jgi:flavin reductase (DIM6/NTAB) family NADH-FMN oxidoreductase RutF
VRDLDGQGLAMGVSVNEFKYVMRQWASGVTVVTLRAGEQVHGLTVSGFLGVSLEPPLVLISIGQELHSHDLLPQGRCFAVNFLRDDQRELSDRFAGRLGNVDRFEGVATRTAVTGAPVFEDCLAWLDCRLIETQIAGDHTLYIGEVVATGVTPGGEPLLYWNADYRQVDR